MTNIEKKLRELKFKKASEREAIRGKKITRYVCNALEEYGLHGEITVEVFAYKKQWSFTSTPGSILYSNLFPIITMERDTAYYIADLKAKRDMAIALKRVKDPWEEAE